MPCETVETVETVAPTDCALSTPPPLGPTRLLRTARLARCVGKNRSGCDVFVDVGGHVLCQHGERAATIESWMKKEAVDATFVRNSVCDCKNVDGLHTKYAVPAESLPTQPTRAALFPLLGELGCEEMCVRGRPQRLAYRNKACGEVWIQPSGAPVCPHGNSSRVLATIRKGDKKHRSNSVVKCECKLALPDRECSIFCKVVRPAA